MSEWQRRGFKIEQTGMILSFKPTLQYKLWVEKIASHVSSTNFVPIWVGPNSVTRWALNAVVYLVMPRQQRHAIVSNKVLLFHYYLIQVPPANQHSARDPGTVAGYTIVNINKAILCWPHMLCCADRSANTYSRWKMHMAISIRGHLHAYVTLGGGRLAWVLCVYHVCKAKGKVKQNIKKRWVKKGRFWRYVIIKWPLKQPT